MQMGSRRQNSVLSEVKRNARRLPICAAPFPFPPLKAAQWRLTESKQYAFTSAWKKQDTESMTLVLTLYDIGDTRHIFPPLPTKNRF